MNPQFPRCRPSPPGKSGRRERRARRKRCGEYQVSLRAAPYSPPRNSIPPTLLYGKGARKFLFPFSATNPKPSRDGNGAMVVALPSGRGSEWHLLVERDFRFGSELLVLAVADDHADTLRTVAKVQRIVAVSGHRKPEVSIHLLPQSGEVDKQILGFGGPDLRNGLPLAADDRVVFLVHPQHALEQPLALQDLAWLDPDDVAIHSIHGLLAFEMRLIQKQLILGQQKRLDVTDVSKILFSQSDPVEVVERPLDHLFGAFLFRREDDVTLFPITAHDRTTIVEFIDGQTLAIGVVGLSFGCFGFALGHTFGQIGRRVVRAPYGEANCRC